MSGRAGWSDMVRSVAQAVAELMRAEAAELTTDLKRSGRTVGRLVLWAVAALFVAFWLLAVLIYAAVEVAHLWLPMWGAALAVATLLAIAVAVFVGLARAALRRLESPARTVRRRLDDHVGWWTQTLSPSEAGAATDASSETDEWPANDWIESREEGR